MYIKSDEYFTYDGHHSYLYGLRFAWIEESPETVVVPEKTYNQIRSSSQNIFKVAKSGFDEALTFDTEITSDRVLYDQEVRRIYTQFFDKNHFKELIVPSESGERIYLNCIITNIEKVEGGYGDQFGVVGFKAKIICDAPWGWTDSISVKFAERYAQGTDSISDTSNAAKPYYKGDIVCKGTDSNYKCYKALQYNTSTTPVSDSAVWSEIYSVDGTDSTGNYYAPIEITALTGGGYIRRVVFYNNSDCQEYIYPKVTIKTTASDTSSLRKQSGTQLPDIYSCLACSKYSQCRGSNNIPAKAMVRNLSDSEDRGLCILLESGKSQTVEIDPTTGIINGTSTDTSDSTTSENKIGLTNKKFIRLLPGENIFELENVIDIEFEYREARILV